MLRTYIDWLTDIPWQDEADDNLDISHANDILDAEHYGLEKVKDRILEYIAVRKLAGDKMKSPILCFVGRSEEHTSELQSLMRNSYAGFCLRKKKYNKRN